MSTLQELFFIGIDGWVFFLALLVQYILICLLETDLSTSLGGGGSKATYLDLITISSSTNC